jgi:hypothetical protein
MKSYVSIDTETTGLDSSKHQILEIGAVIDDWVSPIEDLPKFRCYIDNGLLIQGSPYALSMHSRILRYIATDGIEWATGERVSIEDHVPIIPVDGVAGFFLEWLERHGIKPAKRHMTAAGKNFAGFDHPFLKQLPNWGIFIKTQHRVIDPGNLYFDPRLDGGELPNLKTCMDRAGIPGKVAHTALEDAIVVAKLIRIWFKRRGG